MTQATEANDADALARTAAKVFQGRIRCDSGAQHDRCRGGRNAVWDFEHKVTWRTIVQRMATVGFVAVEMKAGVRADMLGAEVLVSRRAFVTRALHTAQAGVALSADTNTIAHLDTTVDLAAYAHSSAHDLVTHATWVRRRPLQVLFSLSTSQLQGRHTQPLRRT